MGIFSKRSGEGISEESKIERFMLLLMVISGLFTVGAFIGGHYLTQGTPIYLLVALAGGVGVAVFLICVLLLGLVAPSKLKALLERVRS